MLDNDPYYQKILAREEEYRFYEERSMAEDILFPEISEDEFIKEKYGIFAWIISMPYMKLVTIF